MIALQHSSELELASFTPLVFATTGGMGREAVVFYRRIASLLSRCSSTAYSRTLAFIVKIFCDVHPW